MTAATERRYPRTCGHCGASFVAARSHARWCSSRCRLRAWRVRRRQNQGPGDLERDAQLSAVVGELEAPEVSLCVDVCSQQGCRILACNHTADAVGEDERGVETAPWRSAAWNDPEVRRVRARLAEQSDALSRLRDENAVLRRWVSERLHPNPVDDQGA